MLCGFRALKDYSVKDDNAKEISAMLCAKEHEIAQAVSRMKEEQNSLKGRLSSMQQKLLAYKADEIEIREEEKMVCIFDADLTGSAPRELMNLVLEKGAGICAVFAGTDEGGYQYVMGSRTEDVRALAKNLNEMFHGRGGGKPQMVQGSLAGCADAIREYFIGVRPF